MLPVRRVLLSALHTPASLSTSSAFRTRYPPFARRSEPALLWMKLLLTSPVRSTVFSIAPNRFLWVGEDSVTTGAPFVSELSTRRLTRYSTIGSDPGGPA